MKKVYVPLVTILFQILAYTCWTAKAQTGCSTNNLCINLPTGNGASVVCAFNYVSCNDLTPCEADFSCARPNTVCVKHQCHLHPICYPKSMTSQTLCPPVARKLFILNNMRSFQNKSSNTGLFKKRQAFLLSSDLYGDFEKDVSPIRPDLCSVSN
jgi:hypothetical protein